MILKQFHEIKIKDIIDLDFTRSANSLKKYWFIPLSLCKKELESLTAQIFKAIGNEPMVNIENEFDKILSYRRLQILEALYKAVTIELGLKPKIGAWKLLIGKDTEESTLFGEIKASVLLHTGIELNTPDDIDTFRLYIQHKVDKYKEMYPEIEVENKDEVKLTRVIYSVFNYMNEPYNENMPLYAFVEMKMAAEEKIKSQPKSEEDGQLE